MPVGVDRPGGARKQAGDIALPWNPSARSFRDLHLVPPAQWPAKRWIVTGSGKPDQTALRRTATESIMKLDIYLTFDGNCREAFDFYRSCFGGDFSELETFRNGPPDMEVPEEYLDRLMHVALPVGPSMLMGSDSAPGFGPPVVVGTNFSISVQLESREESDRVFASLADGGSVSMPMQDMFWGAYFGSVSDRFGVSWQIHHDPSKT